MTALLAVAVKGVVVVAAAALATHVLRRSSASTRHGIWAVAFAALALLPVLEMAGPRWSVGVWSAADAVSVAPPAPPAPPPPPPTPPAPPPPPAVGTAWAAHETAAFERDMDAFDHDMQAFDQEMNAFDHQMEAFGAHSDAHVAQSGPGILAVAGRGWDHWAPPALTRTASRSGRWLAGLWGAGALVVALGWLAALVAARRVVAEARPETDDAWAVQAERARRLVGLAAPVRLLRSDALDVPVAWGWGGGAVVLPASADVWDDDRREAVLLHEMAHLARRDAWSQALAQAALALHWANPLAWWGYRRFLDAREQACDDAVIRSGARPSAYAGHLVSLARAIRRDRLALAGLAPMARTAPVEARLVSILDGQRRRSHLGRRALGGTVALALAVVVPLAAVQPVARAHDAHAPPSVVQAAPGAVTQGAPVPNVATTPDLVPAVLADTIDALEAAEAALEAAEDSVDAVAERIAKVSGGQVEWELRGQALEAAQRALADVDVGAVVAQALAEAHIDVDIDGEWQVDMEAAFEDARDELREAQAEVGRAQAEVERVRAEAAVDEHRVQRDAQRAQRDARRAQDRRARDEARRAVRRLPPAPSPAATPRPTPPGAVDWSAVDRARRAAERRSSR